MGCGTGLELDWYFRRNPTARVTGIDLSEGMLAAFWKKHPHKKLHLIRGSYFEVPFGENCFDAAVSVESLHHFTRDEKLPLYTKLYRSLKPGGFFILTDFFALTDEEEQAHRAQLLHLKARQGIRDGALYHFDTPLTVTHERKALQDAGFSSVEVLSCWGATHTVKATKAITP